jgi:hypothetical protein
MPRSSVPGVWRCPHCHGADRGLDLDRPLGHRDVVTGACRGCTRVVAVFTRDWAGAWQMSLPSAAARRLTAQLGAR